MRIAQTPPTCRRPFDLSAFDGPNRMFVVNVDERAGSFEADPFDALDASPCK
jgi:hypothetical protein